MDTFFSGTDTETLRAEGSDMPHFVSLIVNNAGKYTAGITRKVISKKVAEEVTYPTWGGEELKDSRVSTEEQQFIEWFELQVTFEKPSFESEILDRIKEIEDNKEAEKVRKSQAMAQKSYHDDFYSDYSDYSNHYNPLPYHGVQKTPKKSESFEVHTTTDEEENIPYGKVSINSSTIDLLVVQILTGCVIMGHGNKINIPKWLESMNRLYKNRFGTVDNFEQFALWYLEYLISNTTDEEALKQLDDKYHLEAIVAYDLRERLKEFPSNPWLNEYIEQLEVFIV